MRYFEAKEFACNCCNTFQLAEGVLQKLEELRGELGQVMLLTSAARCRKHNKSVGGHSRSLHVFDKPHHKTGGCCAFDVKKTSEEFAAKLIKLAWLKGWSIGISNSFIHIDRRSDFTELPQTMFYYSGYQGVNYNHLKESV